MCRWVYVRWRYGGSVSFSLSLSLLFPERFSLSRQIRKSYCSSIASARGWMSSLSCPRGSFCHIKGKTKKEQWHFEEREGERLVKSRDRIKSSKGKAREMWKHSALAQISPWAWQPMQKSQLHPTWEEGSYWAFPYSASPLLSSLGSCDSRQICMSLELWELLFIALISAREGLIGTIGGWTGGDEGGGV